MGQLCTVYLRCDTCDELVEERCLRASHQQDERHRRLMVDLHGQPRATFRWAARVVRYHKAFDQEFCEPQAYVSAKATSQIMYVLSANVYRTQAEAIARLTAHLNTRPSYERDETWEARPMAITIHPSFVEARELRYYATMDPYSEDDGGFVGRWHFIKRDLTLADLTRQRGAQPAWTINDGDIYWDRPRCRCGSVTELQPHPAEQRVWCGSCRQLAQYGVERYGAL